MARGKGHRKWRKRRQRERAPKRPNKPPKNKRVSLEEGLPPCSNSKDCPTPNREASFLIVKPDESFFSACEACVEPMAGALRLKGVDAKVVSKEALTHFAQDA